MLESARAIRFDVFEVDLESGELRRAGERVPLQQQPFRILVRLLERPGRVVAREELRAELWPADTFVDFEHGLNAAIRRLREALGDEVNRPRYVETVPRRGYRFIAHVECATPSGLAPPGEPIKAPGRFGPKRWLLVGVAGAALMLAGAYATTAAIRATRQAWAYRTLPEIERLADAFEYDRALRLSIEVGRILPADSELARLRARVARSLAIDTDPPGADVDVKGYLALDAEWIRLGRTPIREAFIPFGMIRLRVTRPGFEPFDLAVHTSREAPWVTDTGSFFFRLTAPGEGPPGMRFVPGHSLVESAAVQLPDDYWMDRYEVTNRAFKEFVDADGYTRREFWRHPFVFDGHEIPWERAMDRFRDATGRHGPATWRVGSYPDDQDDYPVGGVSWYEADAYAAFTGKSLPTVDHWLYASGVTLPFGEHPARLGNFSGRGPRPVGEAGALSTFGFHDMAGNVREWAWNASSSGLRYLMGGGWGDEPYVFFRHPDSNTPWDRAPQNGFRLVKYSTPPAEALLSPIPEASPRDPGRDARVSAEVFDSFRRLFAYDRADLDPHVDAVDDEARHWRDETVSYRSAQGAERTIAHVLLPRVGTPPYQVVVFYPGDGAFATPWGHPTLIHPVEFILRSGRAVIYPVYRGMFGRPHPPLPDPQSVAYRQRLVHWHHDIARSIDYVETRADIDDSRVAYYGVSRGAIHGLVFTALEPRLKASILRSGGFPRMRLPPEADGFHYAPRVAVPTLMLHGEYDAIRPLDSQAIPLFKLLGTPPADKRLAVAPKAGHLLPFDFVIRESLDWLDRYLGPVGAR